MAEAVQHRPDATKKAGPAGSTSKAPPTKLRNHEWVGRCCKLFSKKVNYPAGGWLTGVVRQYSKASQAHLVVYDDKSRMPEWVEFSKTAVEEITELEKKVRCDETPEEVPAMISIAIVMNRF